MSTNMQNLSPAEQNTLGRHDFRPLINPDFVENPSRSLHPLRQACADCLHLESMPFSRPDGRESNIRRTDVEEFCNTWVRYRPWEDREPNTISGYWTLGDHRSRTADIAILLVQYKTFRVCVQGGRTPNDPEILISTEDIRHLLNAYLELFQGELLPPVVAYSMFDSCAFQFLIIPEPEDILRDSIDRFNEEEAVDDASHLTGAWIMAEFDQEITTLDQVTFRGIQDFRESEYCRHLDDTACINYGHVLSARAGQAQANVGANRFHSQGP